MGGTVLDFTEFKSEKDIILALMGIFNSAAVEFECYEISLYCFMP